MKTVLVIEDNTHIRENTSEMLEMEGYKVMVADNGKKGIELAAEHVPDVILCDILMNEGDGYHVFSTLKSDVVTATIPFIFVSAKAEKNDVESALASGATAYIRKPFAAEELFDTIARCLVKDEMKISRVHE